MSAWKKFWTDEEGVASVETALVIFLVGLAAVATWKHLASTIGDRVTTTSKHLTQ